MLKNSVRSKEGNGAAPEPEPEASPVVVRSKVLRCTARLLPVVPASHGCPSETATGDNGVRAEEAAVEAAPEPVVEVQQEQQLDFLREDELPVDLDFDMGELGFLSPWCGEVGGGVGPGGWFGGDEVSDLETLLLGPGGDGELHKFAWF
jgi:myb proto-oncogene protein